MCCHVGLICQGHVDAWSTCQIGDLKKVMKIWTSCKPISKFSGLDVHFKSLGIEMTYLAKFKDPWYILLKNKMK